MYSILNCCFIRHYSLIYTVGHKKRATLFGIITPMFCGGFLHFLHQWKQEKYSIGNYKICNFATIVSLHYLRKHTQQHILKPTVSVF